MRKISSFLKGSSRKKLGLLPLAVSTSGCDGGSNLGALKGITVNIPVCTWQSRETERPWVLDNIMDRPSHL